MASLRYGGSGGCGDGGFQGAKKKKNLLKNLICALLSQSGLQIHTVDTVHRHFLIR